MNNSLTQQSVKRKTKKNQPIQCVRISFVIILNGAMYFCSYIA